MHLLLDKLLKKRRIKSAKDLSSEEKTQFDNWARKLEGKEISVGDIKNFIISQINIIKSKLKDTALPDNQMARLILQWNVYESIIGMIESPQTEKERLEQYLQDLLQDKVIL